MTAWWLTGDTRTVMVALPAGSVDLVLTSPPFLALRSYLPEDDPAKVDEIGSEANPAEFIDTLLDVTEACARLLAPHGTLCVELGDTYSGSGGAGGDWIEGKGNGWPLPKSLALIPEAYRMALAYGRNPHNGRITDPWRIRNVIRWVRPNPPVGALGDKFRCATSEMVVACKSGTRWFDLDAVRQEWKNDPKGHDGLTPRRKASNRSDNGRAYTSSGNPAGAPPLDWWEIPPGGYDGAHFAVYPPALCIRPIEAMCPRRVCLTCGKPSRRLTSDATYRRNDSDKVPARLAKTNGTRVADGVNQHHQADGANASVTRQATTTGWSTCGCPGTDGIRLDGYHTGTGWRAGIVLDPFGGSGTTAAVASGHSRDSISIDLDSRNVDLARARIGMWFVETTAADLATKAVA